jgi:hypothetical protein
LAKRNEMMMYNIYPQEATADVSPIGLLRCSNVFRPMAAG